MEKKATHSPRPPAVVPGSPAPRGGRAEGRSFEYQPESFFFLRSPLLPFDRLEALLAAEAAGDDASRRLLELAAEPAIAEALFVASPDLAAGLERAAAEAGSGGAPLKERLRQPLVRYLLRLATRSTPFGLFAGGSLGRLGEKTELALEGGAGYRRHARLDMAYLDRLARDLENDPALRRRLEYRPNSSLYRAASRVRYAEGRLEGGDSGARAYHLVSARADLFLDAALARAAAGASLEAIAAAVAAADPAAEIAAAEAEAFVHELIDGQLLVSDLAPPVTGQPPIETLLARLAGAPGQEAAAARLAATRDALATLGREPLGAAPERYRRLAAELETLGTRVDLPRLFQVDLTKEAPRLRLGPAVVAEVEAAVTFLRRLRAGQDHDPFTDFREAFLRRYEPGRRVPLAELLDEEAGIGFQRSAAVGSDASPLLQGIVFPPRPAASQVTWSRAQDLVLRKVVAAAGQGQAEVVFSDADLAQIEGPSGAAPPPAPFYTAFQAIFAVAAPSPEAIDRGELRLLFRGASGASGGTLLGRFCHADPQLAALVREHLRHEESHQPDAVFAEIVHWPEGRLGNILLRPLLRDWEIPFLGRGGAAPERQLPLEELEVTVAGNEVLLLSKRLDRRVIPRLSSAHNYSLRGLGVYKFLSALQHQGTCGGLSWQWGALEALPSLPRVVYGRTILAPARWRVEQAELASWLSPGGEVLEAELERWRASRRIPRRVLLADADNELFVDFTSPLVREALLSIVRKRPAFVLVECLQEELGLTLSGPEGCFTHEIVLPFVRRAATPPRAVAAPPPRRYEAPRHPPGSRWVYAKLYTGAATADGVLDEVAGRLLGRFGGDIATFFFLRYADPELHLRLRFEVPNPARRQELCRRLTAAAERLLRQGRIWDLRFDTYKPEIERYGGPEGLRECERVFAADSRAALALLPHFQGDRGAGERWLAALAAVDGLISAVVGTEPAARLACLGNLAGAFAAEFRFDKASRQSLADRLRADRERIAAAVERRAAQGTPLAAAFAALAERQTALREPLARLARLAANGRLGVSLQALAGSFAHLAVNRLIPAEARAHEAVIYELLHRHLLSRQARLAAGGEARPSLEQPAAMVAAGGG